MTAVISGTNGLLQAYDYQTPTTGFSYTFAAGTQVLVMNPAGTLATGTITMPASPSDGMTITFSSTKIITALTVNANTGQTINNAVTTLSAGQSASYIYRSASTAWFPYTNVATVTSYAGPNATWFTTTGSGQTFTIPTGITRAKVTVVAGGSNGSNGGTGNGGNGGGAGGGAIKWLSGLTPGNTLTVTVGAAGGASSVASGTQTITTISATTGGGVGTNGDINITGGSGGPFISTTGGYGGTSGIIGGAGGTANGAADGKTFGGGGGGGSSGSGAGSNGAQGVVVFEY
jgi:hypothetical protein